MTTLIMDSSAISCKKRNIYFEWMRYFVQIWFHIDTKMMRNLVQKKVISCKNSKLLHKRICCFEETIGTREGVQSIHEPPSWPTEPPDSQKGLLANSYPNKIVSEPHAASDRLPNYVYTSSNSISNIWLLHPPKDFFGKISTCS